MSTLKPSVVCPMIASGLLQHQGQLSSHGLEEDSETCMEKYWRTTGIN